MTGHVVAVVAAVVGVVWLVLRWSVLLDRYEARLDAGVETERGKDRPNSTGSGDRTVARPVSEWRSFSETADLTPPRSVSASGKEIA